MKTKLLFLVTLLLMSVFSLSAQDKNTKQIPEKDKEVVDPSAAKASEPQGVAKNTDAVPDQYVVLFDESILPSFISSKESEKYSNRDDKKKAGDAYEKKMEGAIKKIAMDKLGITPAMIKSVFSAATTGIVVQLKNDHAKGLKSKLATMKEIVAMVPDFKLETAEAPNSKPAIPTFNSMMAQYNSWGVNWVGSINYTGNKWAWIMDTGIDLDHPDLNVLAAYGADFTGSPYGKDDRRGHGTHCAGIIAAKNNTFGALGVAAGAWVVPVKILPDAGSGSFSWAVAGLNHIAKYYIAGDVVNMSFGGPAPEWWEFWWDDRKQMESCIRNLGAVGVHMVIAAGNESTHAATRTPARTEGTRVYTISACDWYLNMAYYSNHGNGPIDYAAPGSDIYSTYKDGGYAYMSGTSMATPFVAGILLANNGYIATRGILNWDRDGNRDRLAVRQ